MEFHVWRRPRPISQLAGDDLIADFNSSHASIARGLDWSQVAEISESQTTEFCLVNDCVETGEAVDRLMIKQGLEGTVDRFPSWLQEKSVRYVKDG
jgi:hypothetical protein